MKVVHPGTQLIVKFVFNYLVYNILRRNIKQKVVHPGTVQNV